MPEDQSSWESRYKAAVLGQQIAERDAQEREAALRRQLEEQQGVGGAVYNAAYGRGGYAQRGPYHTPYYVQAWGPQASHAVAVPAGRALGFPSDAPIVFNANPLTPWQLMGGIVAPYMNFIPPWMYNEGSLQYLRQGSAPVRRRAAGGGGGGGIGMGTGQQPRQPGIALDYTGGIRHALEEAAYPQYAAMDRQSAEGQPTLNETMAALGQDALDVYANTAEYAAAQQAAAQQAAAQQAAQPATTQPATTQPAPSNAPGGLMGASRARARVSATGTTTPTNLPGANIKIPANRRVYSDEELYQEALKYPPTGLTPNSPREQLIEAKRIEHEFDQVAQEWNR